MGDFNGLLTDATASSQSVVTESLTIGDVTTTHIADQYTSEAGALDLITKSYLDGSLTTINKLLKELNPNNTNYADLTLISFSLSDPYFNDTEDWTLNNWYIEDNILYGKGGKSDNSVKISNNVFVKSGQYILNITVDDLASGRIDIKKNGTWVASIRETGNYSCDLTVDDITNDVVTLTSVNSLSGALVKISSFKVHFIADRLYKFLISKIKELSSVNVDDYVKRTDYEHTLDEYEEQFTQETNRYLTQLNEHKTQENPHNITAAKIGAATTTHVHDQYATKTEVEEDFNTKLAEYSKTDHTHTQYVKLSDASTVFNTVFDDYIGKVVTIDPLIITKAPVGILPSRFENTDINPPLQILVSSTIDHDSSSTFDYFYGSTGTNKEALMNESPKVFALDSDIYASIPAGLNPTSEFISFTQEYHTHRKISGYRFYCKDNKPILWSVYSDNNTLVHTVDTPTYTTITSGEDQISKTEIYFETVLDANKISFIINTLDDGTFPAWEFKIELIYSDFELTEFGITDKEFQFCVPHKGSNRLINVPAAVSYRKIQPTYCSDSLPLYVFGCKEDTDANTTFQTSYYPPEYGTIRKGSNILLDQYNLLTKNDEVEYEEYVHPIFGKLSLTTGASAAGSKLTNIYNSSNDSWKSDGASKKVVIHQTINSDNVIMTGFMLNWRNGDQEHIPTSWILTLSGYDKDHTAITTVIDSKTDYFPIYSVEDDDIVYKNSNLSEITVKEITLTIETTKDEAIWINKLFFYLSERYYSISQNFMYLGLNPVSQACLGCAKYAVNTGWKPYNNCFGRICVVPVNNLKMTETFGQYDIYNPFNTENVITSITNYSLMDSTRTPEAYISSLQSNNVTVDTTSPFYYGLSIARVW